MFGKRFEKELEMIEDSLEDEGSKDHFKEYLRPLVESIAEKYAANEKAKAISKGELIEAGWKHFDLALRNYKEKADLMMEKRNELFYFSTYFTWYVRQGIVEYIKSENDN